MRSSDSCVGRTRWLAASPSAVSRRLATKASTSALRSGRPRFEGARSSAPITGAGLPVTGSVDDVAHQAGDQVRQFGRAPPRRVSASASLAVSAHRLAMP